ncbi:MAG: cytochrome c3 family protein [Mariprofundaceae bacterium]
MRDSKVSNKWQPGKRDAIFLAIVAAVILLLVLGSSERKTKAVPSDQVHMSVTSRTQCMSCHSAGGVKPQPMGHSKADQCFQCHLQPKAWQSTTP